MIVKKAYTFPEKLQSPQISGRDGGAAITEALLAYGTNTSRTDKSGQTARERARNAKLDTVVRLLGTSANSTE